MSARVRWFVLAALALAAMAAAVQRAWVCDDAFITLRYAENCANGMGLVYNPGERVEGYSNPSWTVLCALAIALGIDGVWFAQALGIVCLGLLVPATWWVGQRFAGPAAPFLPLAAVGVAVHRHLGDFASCGLETLGFVLLVTVLVGVLVRAERAGEFALASFLAVLAALTRPDGGLVGALAGGVAVFASLRARSLAPVLGFAAPGFLLFVPFLAWRFLYYGDLLPNTFYAKSAGEPYPGQGWFYVELFFAAYWVLVPALLAALLMPWWARRGPMPWLVVWFVVPYLGFVVWVGGDFMFARFCLPVVPLLYVALELAVRRIAPAGAAWRAVACAVVAAATLCFFERADLLRTGESVRGVADERAQYPQERVDTLRSAGRRLREAMGDTGLRVVFSGTQAMLVYESKVAYALEGVTGLTDRFLARRELSQRGPVGHEKGVFSSPEATRYAFETQRVHFLLVDHPPMTDAYPWLRADLFGVPATLVRWDPAVAHRLRSAEGVRMVDLERHLDDYLASLDGRDPAQVRADFGAFELVYFRWNEDPVRRGRFLEWLARH